jgi:MarR family transcriptional regulator, organic hydroperoxide resistance regulator
VSERPPSGRHSPGLDQHLCFMLYASSRAVIKAYKPLLDPLGLTYPQYLAMLVLWEWRLTAPAEATVKALGERLRLDSGTLTPLLKRLEQLGLIERRRSDRDERQVLLGLTAQGIALEARAADVPGRLLCQTGVDPAQLAALRNQLAGLLGQLEHQGEELGGTSQ